MASFLLDAAFLGLCAGGLRWPWAWSLAAAVLWAAAWAYPPRLRGAPLFLWAACLLWAAVSAAASSEPLNSLAAFARFSVPVLLVLSASGRFSEDDRKGLFWRLCAAALLASALVFLLRQASLTGTGLYSHVNYTACLLACAFAAALAGLLGRAPEEDPAWTAALRFAAALSLAAVLALRSRAALGACFAGAAVVLWRRGSRKTLLALALVLPAALAVAPREALKLDLPSASVRPRIWSAALEVVGDHPLLGEGPGLFERGFLRHQVSAPAGYPTRFALSSAHAHSELLQSAAETGVVGAALLVLALAASLILAWRRPPSSWAAEAALACAAAFLAQALVDNPSALPALGWAGALALAAACPELPEGGRRWAGVWRGLCAAGVALSLLAWWPSWALKTRSPGAALRIAPGDPSLWEALAREQLKRSPPDLAASLASMQEASRLSPSNAVYRLALSELHGVRGDWPAAAAQARAAGELEPSSPQARLLLAEAFCRLGRAGEARAAQDEALRLAQGAPSPETAYDRFVLGARRVPGGCL
ncbi:MAG TPA: hypothetical protein DCM05_18275 [Elusimicrobia bacterium]|nr:hypothetical protein [Elusimicrobiota bacterium]